MAAPDIPSDMHRSERLVYRAWEDGDVDHVFAWMQDPVTLTKSSVRAPYPRSKKELAEHWAERAPAALLCAVITLPSPSSPSSPLPGTPIGVIDFSPPLPSLAHNRSTTLSVLISPSHQRLGYGTEAVGWILEQAFMRLGLHRVALSASPWNVGARRAYEKAGFVLEGTNRKALFREGKFWDTINMCV
ncbi:hypothetical protein PLICRDRAFT_141983, partial [Plicaturopsis crispa FD-325 SS-3]